MKPLIILQINNGKLYAHQQKSPMKLITTKGDIEHVKRKAAKRAGCKPDEVLVAFSSTLDFPEEFTKSKAVLALVHSLTK
jgi:hypothetical protein